MPLDFTVIIHVRQRFGDDEQDDIGLETEAPFVGKQKDYTFRCPGVDGTQQAILLFQSQGAFAQQSLEINDRTIAGGIPASVDFAPSPFGQVDLIARWSGNVMLVPSGTLRENNRLRVRAREIRDSGNVDNFIIDNVVVVYKTK